MDELSGIAEQTIERYSKRYTEFGYDVKTLGWGTKEQQAYRFAQTLGIGSGFENRSVLDIGCGFGDYYEFLKQNGVGIGHYTGFDINLDLVKEAQKRYSGSATTFEVENVMTTSRSHVADIGVMLGVLNFNLKGQMDNLAYSKQFIQRAFELVDEVLIVDFLSTHLTPDYPKEEFVYYHAPEAMLEFALSLSENAVLKHDYLPIPQKEFMLFIYK